jgi:N-acetylneuraminate lyase
MERLRNSYKDKIVYNGYDEMMLSGLIMGADGGIGSTYNFMAEKFVDIYNLFKQNKVEEAQKVQEKANEIISILCKVGVMQAEKEILCQMGLDFGHCRTPFKQLNDDQKLLIKNQIMSVL